MIALLAIAITVGIATAAYAFSWARYAAAPDASDKTKAKHASITTLRDRMLESYHGKTTDLFTSIPGFGMERMPPLYKYVPFEIPDLSTNEVEIEKEIAPPDLLKDVFAKSLDSFRNPAKPAAKKKEGGNPFEENPKGFGHTAWSNAVVRGLQLRLLDLVGLINPDGPKVYSRWQGF
jgi:hypothetical protein